MYSFYARVLPGMEPDTDPLELLVLKACAYMQKDPHARIGQVAMHCDVSIASLYSTFKKQLGITPNAMRQRVLCDAAQELLVTTDLPVEDISSRLGFSSSSYFRKVLRQHTGKTPLQLRKENVL